MAIQRALRRFGPPIARAHGTGNLRASFEEQVTRFHPNDALAYYLVGAAPAGDLRSLLLDPPLQKLDAMLRRSGLPYKHDDLWRVPAKRAIELV
jgi:hypothetical protein